MIDKAKIEEWKALVVKIREEETGEIHVRWRGNSVDARIIIPGLLAERQELIELLRQIEWADNSGDEYRPECPACGGAKPGTEGSWNGSGSHDGHLPVCRLAAFLR